MMTIVRTVRVYDRKAKEWISVDVYVEINAQALADHLGPKAYANRSGKTKVQGGIIVATVVDRTKLVRQSDD